jgi:hypothetical protein
MIYSFHLLWFGHLNEMEKILVTYDFHLLWFGYLNEMEKILVSYDLCFSPCMVWIFKWNGENLINLWFMLFTFYGLDI